MIAQSKEEEHFRTKEIADSKCDIKNCNLAWGTCEASLLSAEKDIPDLERVLNTYVDELDRASK
jgi:hypothetical protein